MLRRLTGTNAAVELAPILGRVTRLLMRAGSVPTSVLEDAKLGGREAGHAAASSGGLGGRGASSHEPRLRGRGACFGGGHRSVGGRPRSLHPPAAAAPGRPRLRVRARPAPRREPPEPSP